MNLYRIIVLHAAPKDRHTSTETYLVAEDDTEVRDWIREVKCHGFWWSCGDDGEKPSVRYDEDLDKEILFSDWILKHKGDLNDEEGWEDAYYGVTKWGWEQIEATADDIIRLTELGIAITADL